MMLLLLLFSVDVQAVEIASVAIPPSVQVENKTLHLNGAGIRSKFFFDIYIAALYLEKPSADDRVILDSHRNKRVSMFILYHEVGKERLIQGWESGFKKNLTDQQLLDLQGRLDRFNAFFVTAHQGDQIDFDFLADGSTRMFFNDVQRGVIEGYDFQQALLSIWLGSKPADKSLKEQLLSRANCKTRERRSAAPLWPISALLFAPWNHHAPHSTSKMDSKWDCRSST
ncbi:MAG: chalcone isomerase family protein, partial [Mariprofundus sp.]|nr:chalcone isomerase family protein [Mariprofundus sp.]